MSHFLSKRRKYLYMYVYKYIKLKILLYIQQLYKTKYFTMYILSYAE
jgi:hypothetical protein